MDLDFLEDVFNEHQPALTGSLLSNLPYSALTTSYSSSHSLSNLNSNHRGSTVPDQISSRICNANEPGAVISKIEDIFEAIADCILEDKKKLTIQMKTRKKPSTQAQSTTNERASGKSAEVIREIHFPSKRPQEAWKFGKSSSFARDLI